MSTTYAIRDHGIYGTLPTGDVVERFDTLDAARRAWNKYRSRIHASHLLTLREEWMDGPTGPEIDPDPEPPRRRLLARTPASVLHARYASALATLRACGDAGWIEYPVEYAAYIAATEALDERLAMKAQLA